jgi:hypothetical protein
MHHEEPLGAHRVRHVHHGAAGAPRRASPKYRRAQTVELSVVHDGEPGDELGVLCVPRQAQAQNDDNRDDKEAVDASG